MLKPERSRGSGIPSQALQPFLRPNPDGGNRAHGDQSALLKRIAPASSSHGRD
jgi:hypothetical protein